MAWSGRVRARLVPPFDLEGLHEIFKHRRVPFLPRHQQEDRWRLVAVDEGVDLGRQPVAGVANSVVRGSSIRFL
ncbi:hypothetical protein B5P43_32705 [Bacillus sp. SRB_336]|nr:hypothetical protein B5P43_32705 [Bacillus sp. SRB_336]